MIVKLPKNRANCFAVVRRTTDDFTTDYAVCGVFANFEDADNQKAAWEQEWKESVNNEQGHYADFVVMLSTFYG